MGVNILSFCIPCGVWAVAQTGVVVAAVAGDFFAEEVGVFEGFVLAVEFDFGKDEACVVVEKFIDLEGVLADGHEPAALVDDAGFAEHHEREGFVHSDFLLKLVAREAAFERRTFNGEVTLMVGNANSHGAPFLT